MLGNKRTDVRLVRQEWPEKFSILCFFVSPASYDGLGLEIGGVEPSEAPTSRTWHMKFGSHVPTAQRGKLRLSIACAHTAGEELLAGHS